MGGGVAEGFEGEARGAQGVSESDAASTDLFCVAGARPNSQLATASAAKHPMNCARIKFGTSSGLIPAKVSENPLAILQEFSCWSQSSR